MQIRNLLSIEQLAMLASVGVTHTPLRVHRVERGTMPSLTKLTMGAETPVLRGYDVPRSVKSSGLWLCSTAATFGIKSNLNKSIYIKRPAKRG